jgi:flagellar biosynthesis protein FlhG
LTDAYALIKVMHVNHAVNRFRGGGEHGPNAKAAKVVYEKLYQACDHFLSGISLAFHGIRAPGPGGQAAVIRKSPSASRPPRPGQQKDRGDRPTITTWDIPATRDGNIKFF